MAKLLSERVMSKIYEGYPWNKYEVVLPELNEEEQKFFSFVDSILNKTLTPKELEEMYIKDNKMGIIAELVQKLRTDLEPFSKGMLGYDEEKKAYDLVYSFLDGVGKEFEHRDVLAYLIANEMIGLGKIQRLLEDDNLEEIMVNSSSEVFVFDREFGLCQTNVKFSSEEDLMEIVNRLKNYSGIRPGSEVPFIDSRLPDGSRINITLPPVSPFGPTMTIRKFRKAPLTITQLIANGTMTCSLAAFLWLHVEGMKVYPMNLLIAGGTSSGKTTTLNALSVFIPLSERVITIEDTLELNLYNRKNWVRLEARRGVLEKEIEMNDLLKNALRMRPDRILVGEVRGEEALTMFNAMNTGHQGMMGTLHANTARETITRLSDPPMNVPLSMFRLLDLILVQQRVYDPVSKHLVRRIVQVSESSVMGNTVSLEDIFSWDYESNSLERSSIPPRNLERLAHFSGKSKKEVLKELDHRKKILLEMVKKRVFNYYDISKVINEYYRDKRGVLSTVSSL